MSPTSTINKDHETTNTRRRRRAVLLSPPGDLGQIIARSLSKLQFDVLLICEPRSSIRFSSLITSRILVHPQVFLHADRIKEAIILEHQRTPIDVVIGSSYAALVALTQIKDQLPCAVFPISDILSLERLNNKQSFSDLCAEISVAIPTALYFDRNDEPDPELIRTKVGYPCVIKPTDASGGDGVRVVMDLAGLPSALSDVRPFAMNGYIAQSFVPGQDLGLSVFAVAGEIRNWTTFICDGFWSTRFVNEPDLLRAGQLIVEHSKFTGVANFDARRDSRNGRLVLFECNPRFFRRAGASRHCGLDFVAAGLAHLGLVDSPTAALTQGHHLSARDLFSRCGIRLVRTGTYPVDSVCRDLVEVIRDPVPSVGAAINTLFQSMASIARPT